MGIFVSQGILTGYVFMKTILPAIALQFEFLEMLQLIIACGRIWMSRYFEKPKTGIYAD